MEDPGRLFMNLVEGAVAVTGMIITYLVSLMSMLI